MSGHHKWSEIRRKPKFEVDERVRILAYPEGDINAYGRVSGVLQERGKTKYHVVNINMPFQGTINAFFEAGELAHG